MWNRQHWNTGAAVLLDFKQLCCGNWQGWHLIGSEFWHIRFRRCAFVDMLCVLFPLLLFCWLQQDWWIPSRFANKFSADQKRTKEICQFENRLVHHRVWISVRLRKVKHVLWRTWTGSKLEPQSHTCHLLITSNYLIISSFSFRSCSFLVSILRKEMATEALAAKRRAAPFLFRAARTSATQKVDAIGGLSYLNLPNILGMTIIHCGDTSTPWSNHYMSIFAHLFLFIRYLALSCVCSWDCLSECSTYRYTYVYSYIIYILWYICIIYICLYNYIYI